MFVDCKKACICSFTGIPLAEAEVVDSGKEPMGIIIREEDIRKISAEMIIVFYDDVRGLVTCKCRLDEKVRVEERPFYKLSCRILERMEELERRRDTKVRLCFPAAMDISDPEESISHVKAEVKNISAGGVGFESKEELKEGSTFSFLMDIRSACIRLKGTILWKKKVLDGEKGYYYRYGGRFLEMTAHQETVLGKLLLQEQIKGRKI